jgi:hypothetical protein
MDSRLLRVEEEESRANRKAQEEEEDVPDVINNFIILI